MIHYTMVLEDCVLVVTYRRNDAGTLDDEIYVQATDILSGETGKAIWTKEQWQAVMMLIADGDDRIIGQGNIKYLYSIAEPAVNMLPASCRPIP